MYEAVQQGTAMVAERGSGVSVQLELVLVTILSNQLGTYFHKWTLLFHLLQ